MISFSSMCWRFMIKSKCESGKFKATRPLELFSELCGKESIKSTPEYLYLADN
jgi:hypothetical protein